MNKDEFNQFAKKAKEALKQFSNSISPSIHFVINSDKDFIEVLEKHKHWTKDNDLDVWFSEDGHAIHFFEKAYYFSNAENF